MLLKRSKNSKKNKWDRVFRWAVACSILITFTGLAIIGVAVDLLDFPMTIVCAVVTVLIVYGVINY